MTFLLWVAPFSGQGCVRVDKHAELVDVTSSLGLLPPDFAWTIAQTVGHVESSYPKLLLSQQQGRHRL